MTPSALLPRRGGNPLCGFSRVTRTHALPPLQYCGAWPPFPFSLATAALHRAHGARGYGLSHIQHTYARDGGGGVQLIYDLREIRANYLRCWFALDLVAIMPVDYITRYITNDLECRYARRQPVSTRSYPGAAALGTGLR